MQRENVYAVFQQGVYRHECGGVFSTLDHAIAAADEIARSDRDNYHSYEVFAFELNKPSCEEVLLYRVDKAAAEAKRSGPRASEAKGVDHG